MELHQNYLQPIYLMFLPSVTFLVIISPSTSGEMNISPLDPVIPQILEMWHFLLTGSKTPIDTSYKSPTPLPPHVTFVSHKEPCSLLSHEDQIFVEYLHRFLPLEPDDLPSTRYFGARNPGKVLAAYFFFFLQQTQRLPEFSASPSSSAIACLDHEKGNPRRLVCHPTNDKGPLCLTCDELDEPELKVPPNAPIRKVCTSIQTSPPFHFVPKLNSSLFSHKLHPKTWIHVLRMTPEEYLDIQDSIPGDILPSHYAFDMIWTNWEKMMEAIAPKHDTKCNVTFEDQFAYGFAEILMGKKMEDKKEFGAKNLFFLMRKVFRDFHKNGKTYCSPVNETNPRVCNEETQKCTRCFGIEHTYTLESIVTFKRNNNLTVDNIEQMMMTLCHFTEDPRSLKRIPWKGVYHNIKPQKIQPPITNITINGSPTKQQSYATLFSIIIITFSTLNFLPTVSQL